MISSADNEIAQIAGKLDDLLREPQDISSFTLAHGSLRSELKVLQFGLQSELKNRPKPSGAQEGQRLEQLRQRLARAETAIQSLDSFLAAVREFKADSRTLPDWEQDDRPWQRLRSTAEQSQRADDFLRAAGITLAVDGVTVTCRDVVTSLSQRAQEIRESRTGTDEQGRLARRTTLKKEDRDLSTQRQEKDKVSDGEGERRSGGGSLQVRSEEGEKGGLVQRRLALLVSLRETMEAAEQLRLQEPSLPALQHRYHTEEQVS